MSLPTDAGQEDHVSISARLALRLNSILPHVAQVLAIELAFSAQAAAVRKVKGWFPSKTNLSAQERIQVHEAEKKLRAAVEKIVSPKGFEAQVQINLNYRVPESSRKLSPSCEKVLDQVYKIYPPVKEDRVLSTGLQALAESLRKGVFTDLVDEFFTQA